ncbi:EAL domain-containing protein [Campylobacter sp. faydin G-105]|uniref:GGDEF domain-containing phosphodiesterase n=1 Tax=Campylobacter anatolicus TaxID=2829105 RepID=UPI001B93739B|nr:GGDEF domain-containing phosphodiesterase [Campylobacter anatolicus]MBR8461778.1 EAL domain-containing protein [Campylobacter anatolicus]
MSATESLKAYQKRSVFIVLVIFVFAQIFSLIGYVYIQKLLTFIAYGFIIVNIYKHIVTPENYRVHWILLCLGVALWGACDLLWFLNTDLFIKDYDRYEFLLISYSVPMLCILFAMSIYFYIKFKDASEKSIILLDTFGVFLMIYTLFFNVIFNLNITLIFKSTYDFCIFCVIIINLILLFVVLSELFTSNFIYIRKSGFYMIVAVILFTMLNLYIYYNKFKMPLYQPNLLAPLYILPFCLLMIGSFYLQTNNSRVTQKDNNITMSSKWLPIIAIVPIFIESDFSPIQAVVLLCIIVINTLTSYYVKSSTISDKLLTQEKLMHNNLEKIIHEQTNELRLANLRLQDISERDYLTGVGNRLFLSDGLKNLYSSLKSDEELAVYYINIDKFKSINASYGHIVGDRILRATAKRLLSLCNQKDIISRMSAGEFVVVTKIGKDDKSGALNFGINIKKNLQENLQVDRFHFIMSCFVGISIVSYRQDIDIKTIVKNSNRAMYYAKENPSLNPTIYSSEIDDHIHTASRMEILLSKVNLSEEIKVYFQPIFNTKTLKIVSFEALLRWDSKELGFLEASQFMDVAKVNSDTLNGICSVAAIKTVQYVSSWQKDGINIPKISLNIIPTQIKKSIFIQNINDLLKLYGVSPKVFELELDESVWAYPPELLDKIFNDINSSNISVCIDDYGIGYTSFAYMKKYHIRCIKIARELIQDMLNTDIDTQIVASIINLANNTNLKVTAKGVQSKDELDKLIELGCKEAQGCYLKEPMCAEEFKEFLKQNLSNIEQI